MQAMDLLLVTLVLPMSLKARELSTYQIDSSTDFMSTRWEDIIHLMPLGNN